jgi:hypothetical protein
MIKKLVRSLTKLAKLNIRRTIAVRGKGGVWHPQIDGMTHGFRHRGWLP